MPISTYDGVFEEPVKASAPWAGLFAFAAVTRTLTSPFGVAQPAVYAFLLPNVKFAERTGACVSWTCRDQSPLVTSCSATATTGLLEGLCACAYTVRCTPFGAVPLIVTVAGNEATGFGVTDRITQFPGGAGG